MADTKSDSPEVLVFDQEYKSPGSTSLKDWIDQTVGIVVREANTDDDGNTKSVLVDVYAGDGEALGTPTPVRVGQSRIIGQLAGLGKRGTDRTIAAVVAYGKRGFVLAPPPEDSATAELVEAVKNA